MLKCNQITIKFKEQREEIILTDCSVNDLSITGLAVSVLLRGPGGLLTNRVFNMNDIEEIVVDLEEEMDVVSLVEDGEEGWEEVIGDDTPETEE